MKKYSKKVHYETTNEVVWIRRNEVESEGPINNKAEFENGKLPIVYSKKYSVQFCGLEKAHPFDARKGYHILKFLKEGAVLEDDCLYEPAEITQEELLKVHTAKYLKSLKWSINAAKISEIPLLLFVPNKLVQRGYLRPMRFQTAGSILAGKLALRTGWAINLGGGFHHCCSYKGGGFCPYADITLLIARVFEEEPQIKKIMIVDLDAHQGNGHERDFNDNENVYILDMYNKAIYPRDHTAKLAIRCAIELLPFTNDITYLRKLKSSLINSIEEFKPDFLVYNAGTDVLRGDPLGLLSITPEGIIARDEFVFATCRQLRIPVVMLLSGGYLKASARVIANSVSNLKVKGLFGCYTNTPNA